MLEDPRRICDDGIEAVVCLAPERLPDPWPRDLEFVRVPLTDDGENDAGRLRRAIESVLRLLRHDVPTLVVCSMGQSRSVAVTASAIARSDERDPDDVLREIADSGPTDLSPAFWESLKSLSP